MDESRFFVVTQSMPAKDVHGHWFTFFPERIYEAEKVAATYLIAKDPDKPSREIYLRLPSPWWWQRVQFTPETLDLSGLFKNE